MVNTCGLLTTLINTVVMHLYVFYTVRNCNIACRLHFSTLMIVIPLVAFTPVIVTVEIINPCGYNHT